MEAVICEVMAGWMAQGFFELDKLTVHLETCAICAGVMATLARELAPEDDDADAEPAAVEGKGGQ